LNHTSGQPAAAARLTDCERYLGPDHPMTRIVRVNLNAATLTWQCRGGLRVVDASVTVTRCA